MKITRHKYFIDSNCQQTFTKLIIPFLVAYNCFHNQDIAKWEYSIVWCRNRFLIVEGARGLLRAL